MKEPDLAIAFTMYGTIGYLIFRTETLGYWQLRLLTIPTQWNFFALSTLSYAGIFLSVGSLSLVSRPTEANFLLILQAVLLGPFFEEMLFRDFLFRIFQGSGRSDFPFLAVVGTAIAFTVVHLGWQRETLLHESAVYFLAGILLACLRWLTRTIAYPLAVHIAVNATILWL